MKSEAEAVAEIVEKGREVRLLSATCDGVPTVTLAAVPEGQSLESVKVFIDEYRTAPERKTGTAAIAELSSFIAITNRHKDDGTALFASLDPKAPYLLAVHDYHKLDGSPRYGTHRARYSFPLSEEWTAWHAKNNTGMDQGAFAEFLENRLTDVLDPFEAGQGAMKLAATTGSSFASPQKLLELSRGLKLRVTQTLRKEANLSSGECQMVFAETHEDAGGAPLSIPTAFLLALRPFRGGAAYQVAARLRYRVKSGAVTWFYELWRADRVFDDACAEACATAQAETGCPLYVGSPEA